MSISAAIRRMLEAGLTIEQALIAAEAIEQEIAPVRTARQERNRRYYEKKASEKRLNKTVSDVSDVSDVVPPKKEKSPTPPKEKITPSTTSEAIASSVSLKIDFEAEFENQFWPIYPRRVGKGQALKAFKAARKNTDLETILAGVRRYAEQRRGENPEFTKHASTWLNGQCWLDEPIPKHATQQPKPSASVNPRQQMWLDEYAKQTGRSHEPDSDTGNIYDHSHGSGYSRSDDWPVRLAFSRNG